MSAQAKITRTLCDKALIREERLDANEMLLLDSALRQQPLNELRTFMEKWRFYLIKSQDSLDQLYQDGQAVLPVLRLAEAILDVRERSRAEQISHANKIRALRRGIRAVLAVEYENLAQLSKFTSKKPDAIAVALENLAGQARPSTPARRRLSRIAGETQLTTRQIGNSLLAIAMQEAHAQHCPLRHTAAFFECRYILNGLDPNLKTTGNMSTPRNGKTQGVSLVR
jgi:hypothetical protein